MEHGFWAREERDELRLTARSLRATVELHYLEVSVDELCRRLHFRNQNLGPGVVPIERGDLQRWAEQFEAPDANELALFDRGE
jgi:predicted kinase